MASHTSSKTIAVLMGPTGSGKSAMALAIAASRPTVIINADAMQMVEALRVLSARPSAEEERQAEHALYGVLAVDEPTSVARWLTLVQPVISRAFAEGKLPLLVGGTGMYIKALMEGLATIPPIPEPIRQKYRTMPQAELHPALAAIDPALAAQLKAGDTQRLIRALEVIDATGESLLHWQQQETTPLFPDARYYCAATSLPRDTLYARIDHRFELMMQQGALDEARGLLALLETDGALTAALPQWRTLPTRTLVLSLPPIFRAHGVPELIGYLRGEMSLAEAIAKGQQLTRNYAKRQLTWLRNQLPDARHATPANFIEL